MGIRERNNAGIPLAVIDRVDHRERLTRGIEVRDPRGQDQVAELLGTAVSSRRLNRVDLDDDVVEKAKSDGFAPIVNTRTGEVLRFGADAIDELESRTDLHDIAASHASRIEAPVLSRCSTV